MYRNRCDTLKSIFVESQQNQPEGTRSATPAHYAATESITRTETSAPYRCLYYTIRLPANNQKRQLDSPHLTLHSSVHFLQQQYLSHFESSLNLVIGQKEKAINIHPNITKTISLKHYLQRRFNAFRAPTLSCVYRDADIARTLINAEPFFTRRQYITVKMWRSPRESETYVASTPLIWPTCLNNLPASASGA